MLLKKLKYPSYRYYPGFVKSYKNKSNYSSNRFYIKQFFVLLYDCVLHLILFEH